MQLLKSFETQTYFIFDNEAEMMQKGPTMLQETCLMQLFRMQFQNQLLKERYNGLRKQLSNIIQNQEDQRQRRTLKILLDEQFEHLLN